ncbi:hypothetical protein F25303_14457 [Fusarium sp. NRRL 25303]|nr:hypothetical protein F25303_14457 [Fusarium sp. NRRL 25303]
MDTTFYGYAEPKPSQDDAVSPTKSSWSLIGSVATSPSLLTPIGFPLSRSETLVHQPESPSICSPTDSSDRRPKERKIDRDCFPEVVVSDDLEPARSVKAVNGYDLPEVAYSVAPELSNQFMDICDGLAVVASPEFSIETVTPLHLLGDQPDWIDCPFCEKRAMTLIKRTPSTLTHIQAAILLIATGPGAALPYATKWCFNTEHYCESCGNRVAYWSKGKDIFVCKASRSSREASKYSGLN